MPALRGATLSVEAGEIVGLVGPNGAGKSTLLHAVMGRAPIASGIVRFEGRPLAGVPTERCAPGIALVPEGRHIFADLTVDENLRLGLVGRGARQPARISSGSGRCSRSCRSFATGRPGCSPGASNSSWRSPAR